MHAGAEIAAIAMKHIETAASLDDGGMRVFWSSTQLSKVTYRLQVPPSTKTRHGTM